jgi:hypothetical protein
MKKGYKAILKAYADCHSIPGYHHTDRNLKFKSGVWLDPQDCYSIMSKAVSEGYNAYNSDVLKQVLDYFGDQAKYKIAREGSVCLYVKTLNELCINRMFTFINDCFIDEVHLQKDSTIRLWWD